MAHTVAENDHRPGVLGRAAAWGAICGGGAGAVIGSFAVPFLGTIAGGVCGAVVGVAFGLVNGLVLRRLVGPRGSRGAVRTTAAAVSAGCGLVTLEMVPLGRGYGLVVVAVGYVAVCAAFGAVAGPAAAFGLERTVTDGQPRREPAALIGIGLMIGASAGGAIGAIVGLVIGLLTYLPTAFFALIEGAVFGTLLGLFVGVFVATGMVIATSRVRQ